MPLYTLNRRDERRTLTNILENLDEHVYGNDHFGFSVFPYFDTALTRIYPMHR
ncbi:D-arabinono-1,4-lactone oxidase [Mycobacterium leprae]|uniref:D-arabinono-1,4-lactone oxidase n=1 Tax=Mycobacterium leprae TaxID=1769 RepID=UPI0022AA1697|nr:D-arabinono-1,4-lactone oxidase [Mycobacterium leprae]